jgi:hypothetical protein
VTSRDSGATTSTDSESLPAAFDESVAISLTRSAGW